MGMFVRLRERTSAVMMDYIDKSYEKHLGEVLGNWWRYEFQTTQGNFPHIHRLLWIEEKNRAKISRFGCRKTFTALIFTPKYVLQGIRFGAQF